MAFMQPQLTRLSRWVLVDGNCGVDAIPFDAIFPNQNKKTMNPTFSDVEDFTENREAFSIEVIDGYGVRLSAPGYLDCTPWEVFTDESKAQARFAELKEETEEGEG